jgi:hypothetical protein
MNNIPEGGLRLVARIGKKGSEAAKTPILRPRRVRTSERYPKDHIERERIRRVSDNRPVEAKYKVGFYKVGLEETVFDRKTLHSQRSNSKLR